MQDASVFDDSLFGFHAQQVAERALKAWLAGMDAEYPRTHDLGLLLSLLADRGPAVESFDSLVELNPFAVQFRYGAYEALGEPLERLEVLAMLHSLLLRVKGQLPAS